VNPTPEKSPDTVTHAGWLNWLPGIAGLLATILIGSYLFTFQKLPANENPAAWGTFGDYMGDLLNPLISLFTLIVAMKVWGLQKTELLETRKAVEEQGKTAEQQRREQRFFDLLNLYQETLKTFVVEGASGKAAFNIWPRLSTETKNCVLFLDHGWESFCTGRNVNSLELEDSEYLKMEAPGLIQLKKEDIDFSWNAFSPQLGHYFRTIFSILRELEELLKDDHIRYGKLFRAQLSRDELTLLAFNLLFDDEGIKMRSLVKKYGLLKHLANNKLRDQAIKELDPMSFGRRWAEQHSVTPREDSPC
jgi:hypothetical protein